MIYDSFAPNNIMIYVSIESMRENTVLGTQQQHNKSSLIDWLLNLGFREKTSNEGSCFCFVF